MCRCGDRAAALDRRQKRDSAENRDEVFRRNREEEHHQDRSIRIVDREGEQQAVERPRCADRGDVVNRVRHRKRQQRQQHRYHRGADASDEVELQEELRAPHPLELHAEHPEDEHVEQDVRRRARVQEHVGHRLPQPAMLDHLLRHEAKPVDDGVVVEQR